MRCAVQFSHTAVSLADARAGEPSVGLLQTFLSTVCSQYCLRQFATVDLNHIFTRPALGLKVKLMSATIWVTMPSWVQKSRINLAKKAHATTIDEKKHLDEADGLILSEIGLLLSGWFSQWIPGYLQRRSSLWRRSDIAWKYKMNIYLHENLYQSCTIHICTHINVPGSTLMYL